MPVSRGIAGVVALVSLPPAAVSLLWSAFVFVLVAHGPDPLHDGDGDACCDYADTWGQVAVGAAWGMALVISSAALLCVALVLARFALRGTPTRAPARAARSARG